MITKEIIDKICHRAFRVGPMTKADLIRYGLVDSDIEQLLNNKIITLMETGEYDISSFDAIYSYAMECLNEGDIYKSFECFKRCYEINPKHKETNLQLLIFYVSKRRYTDVYYILDSLSDIKDPVLEKKINLYLYLISYFMELPEKYKDKVSNMTRDDLIALEEPLYNFMVDKILICKHLPAVRLLNESFKTNTSVENKIIKALLSQIITYEHELSKELLRLSSEERYHDIEEILSKRRNNVINKYILMLTQIIQRIIKTKEIPTVTGTNTDNMFDAIECNDFDLALSLNKEYLDRYNLDENNAITCLLIKINELIESLQKINTSANVTVTTETDNVTVTTETDNVKDNNEDINISFVDLIQSLLGNNIEIFSEMLRKYLLQIQKTQYEFLIMQLTKLCVIEGNNSYTRVIKLLVDIDKNNYNFDAICYVHEFYQYLVNGKLQEAKICVEILRQYYENKQIIEQLSLMIEKDSPEPVVISNKTKEVPELVVTPKKTKDVTSKPTEEEILREKELLLEALHEMNENKEFLITLGEIPIERRRMIHKLVNEMKEFKSFSIGEEPKMLVILHVDSEAEKVDINTMNSLIFKKYKQKKYQKCIDIVSKLLQNPGYNPTVSKRTIHIFDVLAKSYLKTDDAKKAVKYLELVTKANESNVASNAKLYDYTDLIHQINNPVQGFNLDLVQGSNLVNPSPHIDISEFEEQTLCREIKHLEEIAYYISEEQISYDDAIANYHLTDEDIQLIKLIYVKDFYIDGMYALGDARLKEVEKIPNKTMKVINFLKEIKTNKWLYRSKYEQHTRKRKRVTQK